MTLVSEKATWLVKVSGKMADRMKSTESLPTVTRGTVPLATMRTSVTESTCF